MSVSKEWFENLRMIVGDAHLLTDEENLKFYSTDIYRQARELVLAVVRPGTVQELQDIVRLCARYRAALVVRGGGASYTDGYLPSRPDTISIDTSRLDRIDVHADDMYVTVEPGVTWAKLNEALAPLELRTPMWGPFSGIAATVAGSMSHYAVNYGSGLYGVSAESLLGMDVITAAGELISTGSGSGMGCLPFFRFYGPDLTGLFVGDAGALGVKARLTLRLMKRPEGFSACSFGFPDGERALTAMMKVARLGISCENFGLDPRQQKTALTRMESASSWQAARSVFESSRNSLEGGLQVMRMGLAGRSFLKKAVYSAHFSAEGVSTAEAREKITVIRSLVSPLGAEVANSIPTYFRANPFMQLTPILGPNGERWKPTHGVLPFSKVLKHHAEFEALVTEYRQRMQTHRVQLTRMLMFLSTNAFIYEPTFLWEDEQTIYHRRVYPAELLNRLPVHPPNPQGRALVAEIKERIGRLCIENGASHMQVGKDYPYMETRKPAVRTFVREIKQLLDPNGIMNPGALGL